tara:strand:+ start:6771 stop:8762 length:1992 start_codon:yes stop_codon:yes gene_type:complete
MIVKNEGKIIKRMLDTVSNIIDYWVICDTGSTDDTSNIIINYFKEKEINGELINKEWRNFGYNRTYALKCAKNKADYILLLDADMKLEILPNFNKNELNHDTYQIIQYNNELEYQNTRLICGDCDVEVIGVTHEYYSIKKKNYTTSTLKTLKINDIGDGGSKDDKFKRDIDLLKKGLDNDSDNSRYLFYLANSYRDSGQKEKAIETYERRIEKEEWEEETWNSIYWIGKLYLELGEIEKGIFNLLRAYNFRPQRAESIYAIVKYYRENGENNLAWEFCNIGENIKYPEDILFIEKKVYYYLFNYEKSILSFYKNNQDLGMKLCDSLIFNSKKLEVDSGHYWNILSNSIFYMKSLDKYISDISYKKYEVTKDDVNYTSTNPCIFNNGNKISINIRNVNFYINSNNEYKIIGKDEPMSLNNKCKTKNFLCELDKKHNIKSKYEISDINCDFERFESIIEGIEDIRLLRFNGKIWFTGTSRFTRNDNLNQMVFGNIVDKKIKILKGYGEEICQKNWMPFIHKKKLLYLYSLEPLTILEPNLNSGICKVYYKKQYEYNFSNLRGGSQGIEIDKNYYFVIHEVRYNSRRYYSHRIIKLDMNLNLISVSKPFYFKELGIEFVCGVCIDENNKEILISFGKHDKEAYIARINKDKFLNFANDTIIDFKNN